MAYRYSFLKNKQTWYLVRSVKPWRNRNKDSKAFRHVVLNERNEMQLDDGSKRVCRGPGFAQVNPDRWQTSWERSDNSTWFNYVIKTIEPDEQDFVTMEISTQKYIK